MKRDEGSTQIRELLERGSERLTQRRADLLNGLRSAPDQDYGVPPQTAFDALADARQAYRELRAEIEAVETSNSAKLDVLAAIDVLDRGFGRLEGGLATGFSKKAVRRLRAAERTLADGGDDLDRAKGRL